jgi:hypothetical protein
MEDSAVKVATLRELIEWTAKLHGELGRCLVHCANSSEEQHARWLMEYLAEHEERLEHAIAAIAEHADQRALNTLVYDYFEHAPVVPHSLADLPFSKMDFAAISQAVFTFHNEALELYRYLLSRANTERIEQLLQPLLDLEEHETMRMAQQANRITDL